MQVFESFFCIIFLPRNASEIDDDGVAKYENEEFIWLLPW